MYSNKENVNILTSLLVAHGVRHAVVCPGSRNSPIVHNLTECPDIQCHPVTDERSAGFYALGMCQATGLPVAVCVTSGTALLNLSPAVAEAKYQHRPLVVISADRPPQWIDQLDGQTLQQPGVFGSFVRKSVSLPEPHDDETRWYCNRLVNEALLSSVYEEAPVHINVPISEPLFGFTTSFLPQERSIDRTDSFPNFEAIAIEVGERFLEASRPMIVIGQTKDDGYPENYGDDYRLVADYAVVLHEPLCDFICPSHFDEVLSLVGEQPEYKPDFVLYLGDTIVSKRLKKFLRNCRDCYFVMANESGSLCDTFMNLRHWVHCDTSMLLTLADLLREKQPQPTAFRKLWAQALSRAQAHADNYKPSFSQMAAVRLFEQSFDCSRQPIVHYANSSAIRLANVYARHYVYCNRGVNGIEGSLSTAAGYSLVTKNPVFIVIGDLSFFYDSNALWNKQLKGNLRILLLNNGGGGIFRQLPVGDGRSSALDYVMGSHHTSAAGICQSYGVEYLSARNETEMEEGIRILMQKESPCPVLLEVFTDAATDTQVYKDYYRSLFLVLTIPSDDGSKWICKCVEHLD
ncbi:MAG: 2-succinyl-5-enolpyruvyl-6-hydroxy-3-cyclohexene-1-carboxylic-acid synthase [Prevotella sp.]|nr:2-succinyl-5-enolpyruvyl-6-hydroxy-3-cyclohexene-1-carboxylic-acid synthase [Prevotella sp.]